MNMRNFDHSFLCVSESWLSRDIQDGEYMPSWFTVHHSDRDFVGCKKSRGGGVLFAHHVELKCRRLPLSMFNFPTEIDVVCVSRTSYREILHFLLFMFRQILTN